MNQSEQQHQVTENPVFETAGVIRRGLAYGIDIMVCMGVLFFLQGVIFVAGLNPVAGSETVHPGWLQLWVFATVTIPVLIYFLRAESSAHQGTIGKQWLRLKVETESGNRLSTQKALIRNAIKLLPFELNHAVIFFGGYESETFPWGIIPWTLIGLYLLSIIVGKKRQSIHDRLTGTLVKVNSAFTRKHLKQEREL